MDLFVAYLSASPLLHLEVGHWLRGEIGDMHVIDKLSKGLNNSALARPAHIKERRLI